MQNIDIFKKKRFYYICQQYSYLPITFYSSSRNVLISCICKNASSSVEHLLRNGYSNDFVEITIDKIEELCMLYYANPTVIIILRDPIARLKSAVAMLKRQLLQQGLNELHDECYGRIEYAIDPHIAPQTVHLPLTVLDDDIMREPFSFCAEYVETMQPGGWISALKDFNIFDKIDNNYRFFWLSENKEFNVIEDILNYLEINYINTHNSRVNALMNRVNDRYPSFSTQYLEYARKAYQVDYQLINNITFVNDRAEFVEERKNNASS